MGDARWATRDGRRADDQGPATLPDGSTVQVLAGGSTWPMVGTADWDRVNAMTEAEIDANARVDPDNPPLTSVELARMRPVPNPKRIRQRQ